MKDTVRGCRIQIDRKGAGINDIPVIVPSVTIRDLLGTGANGVVFSGTDNLGRKVAVKVWTTRAGKSRSVRDIQKQAFAETRKVAELKHESLVTIYFAGSLDNGWPYVVMEEASGIPLKALPDRSGDSENLRRVIVGQVLNGLAAAEKSGVLHGDLHDCNVIVDGVKVKVIDFGTSLFAGRAQSEARHSRLMLDFVYRTLPELREWFVPLPQLLQLTGLQLLPALWPAFTTFLMLAKKSEPVIRISGIVHVDSNDRRADPIVLGASLAELLYFDLNFLFRRLQAVYSPEELDQVRASMATMLRLRATEGGRAHHDSSLGAAEATRIALESQALTVPSAPNDQ